jgi:hypothetical protein
MSRLLTGGKKLRRSCRHSRGRDSTPYAYLGPGSYGNIGMLVSSRDRRHAAIEAFKDEAHVWQFTRAKRFSTLCLELSVAQV